MKTELDKKYEEFKEKEFHHYLWAFARGEGEFEKIYPDNLEFLEYLNDPEFKDYLKYNKFLTPSLETAKEIWDFLNKECWILLLSEDFYWPEGLIDLKSEVGKTYLVGGYTLKNEEDYGGEGEGDQYWFILSVEKDGIKKFYKLWGYYASYDGGYIDQIEEVVPKEVMRTEWVKK